MITKKFLKEQLLKMQTNYGKDKFDISPELFDIWYEMFADCDENGLRIAVANCIKDSEFPPNIATLMKYYRKLEDDRKELFQVIYGKYTMLSSYWKEAPNEETFKTMVGYAMKIPKDLRVTAIVELAHEMVSFYNDCRNSGRQDIPTIKEYVEGAR